MKKLALLIFAIKLLWQAFFRRAPYALSGEWVFDYAVTSCVEEGTYPTIPITIQTTISTALRISDVSG